jgi:hypothetical protein
MGCVGYGALRREFAPLFLTALRASGGSGRHADAARQVVMLLLIARLLADAQHEGPPHVSSRAPRQVRARRSRLAYRDSLAGRRPQG